MTPESPGPLVNASTTATDLSITAELSQGGLTPNSPNPRYAPCSQSLIVSLLVVKHRPTGDRPPCSTLIDILDNDSPLTIFAFCRPVILDEGEADPSKIFKGVERSRERWWYTVGLYKSVVDGDTHKFTCSGQYSL
jgi:hypothetical protein